VAFLYLVLVIFVFFLVSYHETQLSIAIPGNPNSMAVATMESGFYSS
jgi:hypothetical protein